MSSQRSVFPPSHPHSPPPTSSLSAYSRSEVRVGLEKTMRARPHKSKRGLVPRAEELSGKLNTVRDVMWCQWCQRRRPKSSGPLPPSATAPREIDFKDCCDRITKAIADSCAFYELPDVGKQRGGRTHPNSALDRVGGAAGTESSSWNIVKHGVQMREFSIVQWHDRRLFAACGLRFAFHNTFAPGGNALQRASVATPNPKDRLRIASDVGRYPGGTVRTGVRMPVRIRTARPNESLDRRVFRTFPCPCGCC